jgi:Uma2 family endonuclease
MTQRTVRLQKTVRSRKPEPPTVVWPPRFRVSERGFEMLCHANPDLRLEREANGKVVIMAPEGSDGGLQNLHIAAQLWTWNEAAGLGKAFGSSAGFTFPNTAVRAPDATWIRNERWDVLPKEDRARFAPICPDFVVELRSPSDTMPELRKKMEEYLAQGVRLGWLIDPQARTVEIFRAGQPVEILRKPLALSGEEVLPGFVLDLKKILDL